MQANFNTFVQFCRFPWTIQYLTRTETLKTRCQQSDKIKRIPVELTDNDADEFHILYNTRSGTCLKYDFFPTLRATHRFLSIIRSTDQSRTLPVFPFTKSSRLFLPTCGVVNKNTVGNKQGTFCQKTHQQGTKKSPIPKII